MTVQEKIEQLYYRHKVGMEVLERCLGRGERYLLPLAVLDYANFAEDYISKHPPSTNLA